MACKDQCRIVSGDITTRKVDAIVNAANSSLLGGGGVDGAIHRAGGPEILGACKKIRATSHPDGLPPGEAVATTAGALPARYVIHTVGPIWRGGNNDEVATLSRAVDSCFAVAGELGIESMAFPAISTGVYHFPKEKAFSIILDRICNGIAASSVDLSVEVVLFSTSDEALCRTVFDRINGT